MHGTRTKLIGAVAAIIVLAGAVAGGRHLIAGTSPGTAATAAQAAGASPPPPTTAVPDERAPSGGLAALSAQPARGSAKATSGAGALAAVPVSATPPLVVHTATIDMRVGKGKLNSALHTIAAVAGADGGYVDSSSLSGGTAQRSPTSGTIVFRVLDSDFADAIAGVSGLGTVDSQQIKGKDVTVDVAQNAASIAVLQDEVALLEKKLGQATDIGTFLQIQSQLFPVVQQLQSLQAAQAVLENSAALATVTVGLTAPGAPVAPAPALRAGGAPPPRRAACGGRRHRGLALPPPQHVGRSRRTGRGRRLGPAPHRPAGPGRDPRPAHRPATPSGHHPGVKAPAFPECPDRACQKVVRVKVRQSGRATTMARCRVVVDPVAGDTPTTTASAGVPA